MQVFDEIIGGLLLKAAGLVVCGVILIGLLAGIAMFTPARTTLAEALIEQVVLLRNERNGPQESVVVVDAASCGEEGVAPDGLAQVVVLTGEELHPIEQDYRDRLGELEPWYVDGFVQYRQCVFMVFGDIYGADGREEDLVILYKWDPDAEEWNYVEQWCGVCGALDALGVP